MARGVRKGRDGVVVPPQRGQGRASKEQGPPPFEVVPAAAPRVERLPAPRPPLVAGGGSFPGEQDRGTAAAERRSL